MLNIKKPKSADPAAPRKKRQTDKVAPPSWEQLGSWVALVESGLGPLAGMLVGWSYWLSIVATNAVMALAAQGHYQLALDDDDAAPEDEDP